MGRGKPELAIGLEHHRAGRLQQAEQSYRRILFDQPDDADALHLLGLVASQQGRPDAAIDFIRAALRIKPGEALFYKNLGNILQSQGRIAEAVECFEQVVRQRPDSADAYVHLANNHCRLGSNVEAIQCYRKALEYQPNHPEACANLGQLLREQGHLEEGLTHLRHALTNATGPVRFRVLVSAASALLEQGFAEEAATKYREALLERPDPVAHSGLLASLHYSACPAPGEVFQEHRRWDHQHAAHLGASGPHSNNPVRDRDLRIGYLSPDFRRHPVAFFFEPILVGHTRPAFRCFCYSNVARPDGVTERLRSLADEWREIRGLPDDEAAEQIRKDSIDILVDLAGHTSSNRLLVFARRPAPVQVTYLGYPDTTGMSAVEYRLTDCWVDPPGTTESLHSETPLRLPSGFLCYKPPGDAPPVAALPHDTFTFGSFNNISKVAPETIAAWAAILHAVPGSRLRLKAKMLGDPGARRRILDGFLKNGIEADRLELCKPVADLKAHLDCYQAIDLALDTFPYNGTTTTCEALWMGVPVVTLMGQTHVSRVGFSILSRIGLPALAADSPAAYVDLAVRLARDRVRLSHLRPGLRERMLHSPLLDAAGFVRELETVYREIWRRWCKRRQA